MRIIFLPPDEHPVSLRYPRMMAAIANVEILAPPDDTPRDTRNLIEWLKSNAKSADACLISVESILYGGVSHAALDDSSAWEALRGMDALKNLRLPKRPLYLSNLIPPMNSISPDRSQRERYAILRRRSRDAAVNRALLSAADHFDLLALATSDDHLPTDLIALRDALGFSERVLFTSGMDSLHSVMIARWINSQWSSPPRVFVQLTSAQENMALIAAIRAQIMAVGGLPTDSAHEADLYLVVNPPFEEGQDHAARKKALKRAVTRAKVHAESGRRVGVADVARPRGADPDLIEQLFTHFPVSQLAVYAGTNVGSSLGFALAAGTIPQRNEAARRAWLARRLLEDWAYQSVAREHIERTFVRAGDQVTLDLRLPDVLESVHSMLATSAQMLKAYGLCYSVSSTKLPYNRLDEADFELAACE